MKTVNADVVAVKLLKIILFQLDSNDISQRISKSEYTGLLGSLRESLCGRGSVKGCVECAPALAARYVQVRFLSLSQVLHIQGKDRLWLNS